jgi:serine/threonine protein kinase
LKVLLPELANGREWRERFEREAYILASLNHPNVIAIYDIGREDDIWYIATELVDGLTLRGRNFGVRDALHTGVQIAKGLAAVHAAGIVHRDLKPDNVLLTRDGCIKILDFGLAKVSLTLLSSDALEQRKNLTNPGMVMGTLHYMSPEQLCGLPVDHRSDIFSFGIMLHELLTGQQVFTGRTAAEIIAGILRDDAPQLPNTVPPAVRQIVNCCLEKDPAKRFESARDLEVSLTALSQDSFRPTTEPNWLNFPSGRTRARYQVRTTTDPYVQTSRTALRRESSHSREAPQVGDG